MHAHTHIGSSRHLVRHENRECESGEGDTGRERLLAIAGAYRCELRCAAARACRTRRRRRYTFAVCNLQPNAVLTLLFSLLSSFLPPPSRLYSLSRSPLPAPLASLTGDQVRGEAERERERSKPRKASKRRKMGLNVWMCVPGIMILSLPLPPLLRRLLLFLLHLECPST